MMEYEQIMARAILFELAQDVPLHVWYGLELAG